MTLQDAVRQAIADVLTDASTRSLRALAKAAGISHVTLLRIRDGTEPVSARVATQLAKVLDEWKSEHKRGAEKCARSSSRIRMALRGRKRRPR